VSGGARRLRALLVVLVLLLGAAVAVDRVAVNVAQGEVEQQLIERAGIYGGDVDVSIHGFPFLTQVARGHYDDIEVDARGVSLEDLQGLDFGARLRGVHLSVSDLRGDARPPVPVDTVVGWLVVPYEELARRALQVGADDGLADLSLSPAGDKVALQATLTVLGTRLSGSAEASVALRGGEPQLSVDEVDLGAVDLPESAVDTVVDVVNRVLAVAIDLPSLPYGLQLGAIAAQADGVRVDAAASDIVV
jgi:hypothetical protein